MTATTTLTTAIEAAMEKISQAVTDAGGVPHMAEQQDYGVDWEARVGGEWIDSGDLDGEAVEAVRIFDCDGNRGRMCRTVEEVEAEASLWAATIEQQGGEAD